MNQSDFWQNKDEAQKVIKEMGKLKDNLDGVGKYDKGNAKVHAVFYPPSIRAV